MCCATAWRHSPRAARMLRRPCARYRWTGARGLAVVVQRVLFSDLCEPRHRLFNHQLQPLRACAPTIAYEYARRYGAPPCRLCRRGPEWLVCSQIALAPDARQDCRTRCRVVAHAGPPRPSRCAWSGVAAEAPAGHVLPFRPVPAAALRCSAGLAALVHSARRSGCIAPTQRVRADAVPRVAGGSRATRATTTPLTASRATTTAPSAAWMTTQAAFRRTTRSGKATCSCLCRLALPALHLWARLPCPTRRRRCSPARRSAACRCNRWTG